jgi:galactokinase
VAWLSFLARMSDQTVELSPEKNAQLAHEAEVLEFSEPGGMMDHFSTAIGGIIFLDFSPQIYYEKMNAQMGTFILGDSQEPKDTKYILARVKNQMVEITKSLAKKFPEFSLRNVSIQNIKKFKANLNNEQNELLLGTIKNYEITKRAKTLLLQSKFDHQAFGSLLNEHQNVLRDILRISTPKIDRMIDVALEAGAYGAKINGSGGGGCMFAYAPENPQQVLEAIEKSGGKGYIVKSDFGVRSEK